MTKPTPPPGVGFFLLLPWMLEGGQRQMAMVPDNEPARLPPIEAAKAFVDRHFPESLAAFLTGSAARGADTTSSDLDIVVIAPLGEEPRWATLHELGWPIELWVQTVASYP